MKKIVLISPALLVLVYVIFLAIVKNSFKVSEIKDSINKTLVAEIEEYKQNYFFKNREVILSIDGKINLSAFFDAKLTVNNVTLKKIQCKDYSIDATIEKIEFKLNPLDFMRKKLNISTAAITGVKIIVQDNKLADFYIHRQAIKKLVKLEENEVLGLKDRLKTIFTGNNATTLESGFKEIEVIEDKVIDVDNSKVKLMLFGLVEKIGAVETDTSKKIDVSFSDVSATYIADDVVQKEIRNISGKISGGKKTKLSSSFVLNNISGNVSANFEMEENNYIASLKISNESMDEININYRGDNPLYNDFDSVAAEYSVQVKATNFNNFLQWFLLANSKYYYLLDYKKGVTCKLDIAKDKKLYNIKNLAVNSEDIDVSSSLNYMGEKDIFIIEVNNLNLDDIILNLMKPGAYDYRNTISIFRVNADNDLFKIIGENKLENLKDGVVKINIKNLTKGNVKLSDSLLDFEIVNGSYIINKFIVNLNDMEIKAENQEESNGLFINDLSIVGKDFSGVSNFLNLPDILTLKEFNLKSKVLVYNNTVYLKDYELNGENTKISGSLEYFFGSGNGYLAYIANFDSLDVNFSSEEAGTLKEKLLWLNNFTKNIFVDISIKSLKYGENKEISNFRSKINYSPGYIDFYDIVHTDLNNVSKLSGSFSLNIQGKSPVIDANFKIEEIKINHDLVGSIVNIEKYKNLLLKEPINQENQMKYWVNRLFSIPKFDEIDGNINIRVDKILVNSAVLENMEFVASIENGVFSIKNFKFNGLGGATELRGIVDLKATKVINIILTDTVYNIEDIFKLLTSENSEIKSFKGTIGLGGIIRGAGYDRNIFDNSLNMQFKFIGKNLFIQQIGLGDLRDKLSRIYEDKQLLDMNAREILLGSTGTTFNDFNGIFTIDNAVSNLSVDAKGDGISSKLALKIDSSTKNIAIDALNTSVILNKVGNDELPLYLTVKFTENFANKASLSINT
ncbi:MAG: AsmA-like C-terminal region-containing protein, partial [Rickettsiales bacterium]|nr:AsmA-like C-terminal region-containing protein [Rickettsiales bacterium]